MDGGIGERKERLIEELEEERRGEMDVWRGERKKGEMDGGRKERRDGCMEE